MLDKHIGMVILTRGILLTLVSVVGEIITLYFWYNVTPSSEGLALLCFLLALFLIFTFCYGLAILLTSLGILKGNYWITIWYKNNYKETYKWQQ